MWGALASSAASLGGAYLQYLGQKQANELNLDAQDKANALSVELANTAHRREVQDLRSAGLNPILSAGGSGAASPTLAAATVDNEYAGMGNSANAVGRELSRALATSTMLDNQQRTLANKLDANELAVSDYTKKDRALSLNEKFKNESLQAKIDGYEKAVWIRAINAMTDKEWNKWIDLVKDGIIENAKNSSNINWRNTLSALTGAASQVGGALNSGASAARAAGLARLLFRR